MFHNIENMDEQVLSGWEELRIALDKVEEIRQTGKDARLEVINSIENTTLRITLRSKIELDEYLNSHLRRLILGSSAEDFSCVKGKIIIS
jgi:hypothetical protein